MSQIALLEGDATSAETLAKAASEVFAATKRPDDEATATAVLARSLLASDKYAESARAIQRAENLSAKSSDRSVRLSVAITSASVRGRGDATQSLKDLDAVIKEAHGAKLVQLELEARLALAEIEIATARFQAGRRDLEALEMEASKKGYKYIASRAAAAKKKIPAVTV